MIDFSKLPWDELRLPALGTFSHRVEVDESVPSIIHVFVGALDSVRLSNGDWDIAQMNAVKLEHLAKMCRMVEEFIKKHGG